MIFKNILKLIFNPRFLPQKLRNRKVLGIETSCDDTASAIVCENGQILGEHSISQQEVVLRYGGIMPTIARDLHEINIEKVVDKTLQNANLTMNDVDAIAVTTKPGLIMSLMVGTKYAKHLSKKYKKPLLPIHHMEAHALTARLVYKNIQYPFTTFLISGGHCLIAVVHSVNRYSLLGKSIDDAPGEAFDKLARRLKLHNLSKYRSLSGGAVVEDLAKNGNPLAFNIPEPLLQYPNCNFSFSGIKSYVTNIISKEELKFDILGDNILPNADDICASFQYIITKHLCRRLQRALEFVDLKKLLPDKNRILIVSGGAASNNYFRHAFKIICDEVGYKLFVPPPKFCTDNGIMIAWNGIEKLKTNIGIYNYTELDSIYPMSQSELGTDITNDVQCANIKCKWIKLTELQTR